MCSTTEKKLAKLTELGKQRFRVLKYEMVSHATANARAHSRGRGVSKGEQDRFRPHQKIDKKSSSSHGDKLRTAPFPTASTHTVFVDISRTGERKLAQPRSYCARVFQIAPGVVSEFLFWQVTWSSRGRPFPSYTSLSSLVLSPGRYRTAVHRQVVEAPLAMVKSVYNWLALGQLPREVRSYG